MERPKFYQTLQRYRFYVEDLRYNEQSHQEFMDLVNDWFPLGATIYNAQGLWMGHEEMTVVIEVLIEDLPYEAEDFAQVLKDTYKQDAVLFTVEEVEAKIV